MKKWVQWVVLAGGILLGWLIFFLRSLATRERMSAQTAENLRMVKQQSEYEKLLALQAARDKANSANKASTERVNNDLRTTNLADYVNSRASAASREPWGTPYKPK